MINLIKIYLLVLSLLFFAGNLSIRADATQEINLDENVQAQDLNVKESKILPDNPFYFLKNLGREIQSLFTLNPVKKAELRGKFANEKLIEVKQLTEKKAKPEIIEKGIENYQKEIERVKEAAEKIKEKAAENESVGKFLDKFIQQQILHQRILEKLENQVPPETLEKIKAARERHLEKFEEVMQKLETNKEKIQERLEKNLEKVSTSTLEKVSTSTKETIIKIRDRIMEKIQQRNTEGTTTGTCITLWEPVCGEDGKTYSNECFAKLAGTEVAYKGECVHVRCEVRWWFDNEHQYCQQKQFCGAYMYRDLSTFDTKEKCEEALQK